MKLTATRCSVAMMFHLLFRNYATTSLSALVNKNMPHFHHERLFSTLYTMACSLFPQYPSHIFKVRYRLIFQRDGCFKLILFTHQNAPKESKDLPGNSGVSWILLLEKKSGTKKHQLIWTKHLQILRVFLCINWLFRVILVAFCTLFEMLRSLWLLFLKLGWYVVCMML